MRFTPRTDPARAQRWREIGQWTGETLHDLLKAAAARAPEKIAITDGERSLSYAALRDAVDRMAARYRELGIGLDDVVAIQLPNWLEFAPAFFALERVGAVAVTVSTDFRARELEYILRFSEAKGFVTCGAYRGFDHLAMALDLQGKLPGLSLLGSFRAEPRAGVTALDSVMREEGPPEGFAPHRQPADAVMRMAFTSGTTGNPKGVMHSHETTLPAARILNGDLGLGAEDRMMIWLPLGLNWGYLTLVQSIMAGATAVLLERFSAAPALSLLASERCTYVPTAPASLTAVLALPQMHEADLSALRLVVSGGASAPVETIRAWRKAAPGHFLELYGMLEDGFHTYTRPGDDPEEVAGSVGRVASHMGLRLLDPKGRDVPAGSEGEICAEGPSVHLGYHANPKANEESFTEDGWFRTGDLGFIDGRGNLRISGRVKEMINRGGKKFFPREVEEVLYTHPAILFCAIVGLPDARLGERACLCLVPRDGHAAPTLEEVIAFLGDGFATYKLPERLVVMRELPFTPTGKIQRHKLAKAILDADSTETTA
ncbi:class I adenylate-forming enzyme family protein [Sabulicella rubraurantiaca]|uniref:class I adenylate-forming enzyme family protein n=1 Tax=Sabulicella rubraurantiaca TaxID=2811429 RepID=UPI001A96E43A|nr:class I adenylate-forming enzyme family protein [Sabulicella rubraurantiaca]